MTEHTLLLPEHTLRNHLSFYDTDFSVGFYDCVFMDNLLFLGY